MTLAAPKLGEKYELSKVIEVEGRQGIAVDEDFYYISSSTALYKYDKPENYYKKYKSFHKIRKEANHFGDIDVWNGEIYTGIEIFDFGVSKIFKLPFMMLKP